MTIPVMQYNGCVKTPIDVFVYYNPTPVYKTGSYFGSVFTANSADECKDSDPADCGVNSFLVTVLDTCATAGPYTGTNATIPGNPGPIGAAVDGDVAMSGEDKASVYCLPDQADDVLLCYEQGIQVDPGEEFRAIPRKCNPVDHYVRVRPDRSITLNDSFQSSIDGIQRIRGCTVTLRVEIRPECADVASEVHFYTNVLFQSVSTIDSTGTDDEPMQISATGSFDRYMTFTPAPPAP